RRRTAGPNARLPEPGPPLRATCERPGGPHDARREGVADEGRRAGDRAAGDSGIQPVELGVTRRRPVRSLDVVSPSVLPARDLRESYLPHFAAGIREGGAYSLMCAYNRVDGKAACGSDMLLEGILRGEWGFSGYVVSDCGAIDDIYLRHKVVATGAEAAALAVKTGTDLECGRVYTNLVDAVKQGLITEQEIDPAVKRLFLARFKLGMFDSPDRVRWAQIPYGVLDRPAHRELARRV